MGKISSISRTLTLAAGAIAIALCSASLSMAQTDSRSGADRARDDHKVLKSNIDQPQTKLTQIKSAQYGHITSLGVSAARNDKGCCVGGLPGGALGTVGSNGTPPERLAQASPASEPSASAGSEHPMGGGGMEGSMEKGEGMMGGTSASPAASPGASPAASPGGMPMGHNMGGKMGGGMGTMGGGAMQGGAGGAQPETSPSGGMGGGMKDDM